MNVQYYILIIDGTDAETKIIGYTNFRLEATAPEEMLVLTLDAGLGMYSVQWDGMSKS